jgi:hypothetical protein|tara:strand:- start:379 stop:522 length:144 start_codon:yes stop_codon:yes gene_type:complete
MWPDMQDVQTGRSANLYEEFTSQTTTTSPKPAKFGALKGLGKISGKK